MQQAALAIAAVAAFAFCVHRWASDELERERTLSSSAAAAVTALFGLLTTLVTLAAPGGVVRIGGPEIPLIVVGGVVTVFGVAVSVMAFRTLGSRELALGMRRDRVVVSGPYAWSRHPFYLGWVLALTGIAVMGRSVLALALTVFAALALVRLARGEERWLVEERGGEYTDYQQRVRGVADAPSCDIARQRSQARVARDSRLDLRGEDGLHRFDALVADLTRQLHRQLGALDGHDDRSRVGRLARRERLRLLSSLGLRRAELTHLVGEKLSEATARAGGSRLIDAGDRPFGRAGNSGDGSGGHTRGTSAIDDKRRLVVPPGPSASGTVT